MQNPGGITCHCSIRRHVFGNDAYSTDHGIFSNSYSTQQGRTRTDCCPLLYHGTLANPVRFRLKLPGGINRPRIAIVDEGDTMANEDPGLDLDTLADKGVAANLATIANLRSLLDFNECANCCFIANLAAVKVHEPVNSYVATKLHIRSNALVIG